MAHPGLKSKTQISFSTIFFFFFFSVLSSTAITDDKEAGYMLKFMNALTPPPSDWSNTTDVCKWSGVRCTSYSNTSHISSISLYSMSLTGIIPSGLKTLSYLSILTLDNNSLSGPLPSLANLTMLQLVGLEGNNFSSIPDGCFQGLSFLMVLRLSYNTNLAPWTIPTDLTQSFQLNTLELIATNLVGPLPDIFDSFPRLHTVFLSKNNLSGVLPKSFAQSTINTLWLNDPVRYDLVQGTTLDRYSGLWGTIDVLSSMISLSHAWLQGNTFEGPIPDLSNCVNLVDLRLGDNRLTGVVPASLMKLSRLRNVSLVNNFLQGPVPVFGKSVNVSLGVNTTNGFCLDHAGPCDQKVTTLLEIAAAFGYPIRLATTWKGNNPCDGWSFITCSGGKIKTVNLARQDLTGTISSAFGNLTDLQNLYLGGNNLNGSIPESLATLPQLVVLDVSNNNLSGSIPRFLPKVKFSASGNALLGLPRANGTSPAPASSPTAPKTSRSTLWIAGESSAGLDSSQSV